MVDHRPFSGPFKANLVEQIYYTLSVGELLTICNNVTIL